MGSLLFSECRLQPANLSAKVRAPIFLNQMQRHQEHVDQFDADEWGDQTAYAVDEQVVTQQAGRADGPVWHAPAAPVGSGQ